MNNINWLVCYLFTLNFPLTHLSCLKTLYQLSLIEERQKLGLCDKNAWYFGLVSASASSLTVHALPITRHSLKPSPEQPNPDSTLTQRQKHTHLGLQKLLDETGIRSHGGVSLQEGGALQVDHGSRKETVDAEVLLHQLQHVHAEQELYKRPTDAQLRLSHPDGAVVGVLSQGLRRRVLVHGM